MEEERWQNRDAHRRRQRRGEDVHRRGVRPQRVRVVPPRRLREGGYRDQGPLRRPHGHPVPPPGAVPRDAREALRTQIADHLRQRPGVPPGEGGDQVPRGRRQIRLHRDGHPRLPLRERQGHRHPLGGGVDRDAPDGLRGVLLGRGRRGYRGRHPFLLREEGTGRGSPRDLPEEVRGLHAGRRHARSGAGVRGIEGLLGGGGREAEDPRPHPRRYRQERRQEQGQDGEAVRRHTEGPGEARQGPEVRRCGSEGQDQLVLHPRSLAGGLMARRSMPRNVLQRGDLPAGRPGEAVHDGHGTAGHHGRRRGRGEAAWDLLVNALRGPRHPGGDVRRECGRADAAQERS